MPPSYHNRMSIWAAIGLILVASAIYGLYCVVTGQPLPK